MFIYYINKILRDVDNKMKTLNNLPRYILFGEFFNCIASATLISIIIKKIFL